MQRPTHASRRRFGAPVAAIAAALVLGLSGIAAAQPHGPAMHGGPGIDGMVANALQALKSRLNLNTSQQQAWDAAVAHGQAVRAAVRANGQRVHDALSAELAKAEPDFAAVAALSDQVEQANREQRLAVRQDWLSLYSTFSADQKAIVRDAIAQRIARMQQWRNRMHGPQGQGSGG